MSSSSTSSSSPSSSGGSTKSKNNFLSSSSSETPQKSKTHKQQHNKGDRKSKLEETPPLGMGTSSGAGATGNKNGHGHHHLSQQQQRGTLTSTNKIPFTPPGQEIITLIPGRVGKKGKNWRKGDRDHGVRFQNSSKPEVGLAHDVGSKVKVEVQGTEEETDPEKSEEGPEQSNLPKAIIHVTNVHGRETLIETDETWTVEELKKEYSKHNGSNWFLWYMMSQNGKFLPNGAKLTEFDIQCGSIVYVTSRLAHELKNPVELVVTDLNDPSKVNLVYADVEWPVSRVKKEYESQKGAEWSNCKLYYRGCALKEKKTLADYYISDEVIIHAALSSTPPTQVGLRNLKKCILRKRSCKIL